jgi:tetratricopeptide (TPR) repeat protein
VKRTLFVAIAMFALVRLVRADELEDSYTKLKDAVTAKDPDAVKAESAATFKLAQALINAPQPSDAEAVENWKQRVQYGKEVSEYTEYALSTAATQDPAKAVDLVDTLLAQNPKSKYLDVCASSYLAALGKISAAKQIDGMTKVVAGRPDNEVALAALTEGLMSKSPDRALNYANKLVAVLKTKPKPEGVPEAEWEKAKGTGLASGYFVAGVIYGSKNSWIECDRDLKAALPLNHDNYRLGIIYFYLGLSNYQLGKMTMDRPRIQTGLKYSQQSAAIAGPMKEQASHNVTAIQNELQGRK